MRPHDYLLWLVLALIGAALAAAFGWLPKLGVQLLAGTAALLAVIDAIALWRAPAPAASRRVAHALALGVAAPVRLQLRNARSVDSHCRLYDHHPASFRCDMLPGTLDVPARGWSELEYTVTPGERGTHVLQYVDIEVRSALQLWWRKFSMPLTDTVRVYPNFAAVTGYAQMAAERRLDSIGVHRRRRRGEGLEFHQLRDYRAGDALARIDWRATARTRKLTTREYQDERDQGVVFLLDCGRRMRAADGKLNHFDEALNALLLLAYVALRQGDAVGMSTFSGEPRWVRPRKGVPALSALLNGVFDLQPSTAAPDYADAVAALRRHQPKRSLCVVLTNARDEDTSDLVSALSHLRRRHVVLLANLREGALDEVLESGVADLPTALRVAATHDYLARREGALRQLRASGIRTLDSTPGQLSVELVNRYLSIKAEGIL